LLPGKGLDIVIPAALVDADDLQIVSPYILPTQKIEFETGEFTAVDNVEVPYSSAVKQLKDGQIVIIRNNCKYTLMGQMIDK
jgi:hypothetical protein